MGCKVQKDGECEEVVCAAGQTPPQMHQGTQGHLDLPLMILYHTLPLTPSSASVAFTFTRKEEELG